MFNLYLLNEYIDNKVFIYCRFGFIKKSFKKGIGSLRVQGKLGKKIDLDEVISLN